MTLTYIYLTKDLQMANKHMKRCSTTKNKQKTVRKMLHILCNQGNVN